MAKTKTEDGKKFPAGDYAYVPDPEAPSTWKLRLTSSPGGDPDPKIVGAAVAALGPGFRGQKVEIPAGDLAKVKAKVRAAWKKIHDDDEDLPDAIKESYDPASLDGKVDAIRQAIRRHLGNPAAGLAPADTDEAMAWPVEVYEDKVIVEMAPDTYRSFPYTMSNGEISFGEPEEVEPVAGWKVTESRFRSEPIDTGDLRVLDIREADADPSGQEFAPDQGWVWRVTMVRPGISKNGRRYRPEVLREAVPLYEGAKAFDGHRSEQERRSSRLGRLTGFHANVGVAGDGALESDYTISRSAPQIRDIFISAYQANRPDLIGFSHDVTASVTSTIEAGRRIEDIEKIIEVHSVDNVAEPSAGGRLERLVASRQTMEGEVTMTAEERKEFLAGLSDEDRAALLADLAPEGDEEVTESKKVREAETPPAPTPASERVYEAHTPEKRWVIRDALAGIKANAALEQKVMEALSEGDHTYDQIRARVKETADLWAAAMAAHSPPLAGQKPAVTQDQADKHRKALDGLFMREAVDGVRPFRSLREAFAAFTGRGVYDTEDFNRALLAESVGAYASMEDARRLRESVVSSTWSNALGDSITRRAIAVYQRPDFSTWRKITSEISPINDFRTQRRDRIGGYDVLSVVGEGDVYAALTSPTDEEATFAVTKKGGTEDLTLETIANDDIGAVRRIPDSMGRAAALTLYRGVWVTTVIGNAAIYDGDTLFHANHANTTSDALDSDGVNVLRNLMLTQTVLGESSGWLGAMPKYIGFPPELYATVHALLNPAPGRTSESPWFGLEPLEMPLETTSTNWYLFADPNSIPMLEVGFYQGREDPEILVQDAPAVGSVFTADKITYKVRHIWGLTVLDYRGFQRGTA